MLNLANRSGSVFKGERRQLSTLTVGRFVSQWLVILFQEVGRVDA